MKSILSILLLFLFTPLAFADSHITEYVDVSFQMLNDDGSAHATNGRYSHYTVYWTDSAGNDHSLQKDGHDVRDIHIPAVLLGNAIFNVTSFCFVCSTQESDPSEAVIFEVKLKTPPLTPVGVVVSQDGGNN